MQNLYKLFYDCINNQYSKHATQYLLLKIKEAYSA
jgi:hypothetical protein